MDAKEPTKTKGKARGEPPAKGAASQSTADRVATALDVMGRATSGARQMVLMLAAAVPSHLMSPELVAKLAELEEDERAYQGRRGAWFASETAGPAEPTARTRRGRSPKSRGASSRSKRKTAQ